jgi:hypothetical protein
MELNRNCTGMDTKLADLLLDPDAAPLKVTAHVAGCDPCQKELDELRATMALLDTWEAPEPNPYFLSKLGARLRDEREAAPASWLERLRTRLMYGPQMNVRPLAAMALTFMLVLGGTAYLDINNLEQPAAPPPGQAAVVHDLQTLDSNAQLLDQLESIADNTPDSNAN